MNQLHKDDLSKPAACCCVSLTGQTACAAGAKKTPSRLFRFITMGGVGVLFWWLAYRNLALLSQWLTYTILPFKRDTHLGASVEFFVYEAPKVLMLLALVVFGVGIVRTFFTPERTRRILSGKRESAGNVLAALLGIVTPFCSCSAVPLFIGFVTTGVPLGVTFSFLISAPMVNEVALIALSLPEAIILRKVLKPRLIATFFGIVALSIMLVGYLFNFLM